MTVYELLYINRNALTILHDLSIHLSDVQYLPIYEEYRKLVGENQKMTYIQVYLCEKFRISKTTFYTVIRKFGKEINSFQES